MPEIIDCPAGKVEAAIDALIVMTVNRISEITGENTDVVLPAFLSSSTGRLLCSPEARLWWDGPAAIAEMYFDELRRKGEFKQTNT